MLWIDEMAIPTDAPHPDNAHKFINFILRPEIAAEISNAVAYANPNAKATKLVDKDIRDNPNIYPPEGVKKRLPKDKGAPQLDFLAGKGPMAVLVDQYGVQVRCTEWPASLLSMLTHGVLRGEAQAYAENLCRAQGQVPPGAVRAHVPPVQGDAVSPEGALQDLPAAPKGGRAAAAGGS